MTKSVVRAMDAIQQFLGQQNIIVPEEFVIGGASKRGWMSEHSVVRAMDAIQQFLGQQNIIVPEEFVIGGASKRGWMTWTTAAVNNKRVIGAVPIVMDLLNFRPVR
ncbi:unnamed protein product [Rotaria sordida]|uniref:Uncharacterized protein n=1 Tax=Rotaria sordida TaxID=392033 RepID=A0A814SL86_9BILA|nr:unnamed protein product [Rotaria sordida]